MFKTALFIISLITAIVVYTTIKNRELKSDGESDWFYSGIDSGNLTNPICIEFKLGKDGLVHWRKKP